MCSHIIPKVPSSCGSGPMPRLRVIIDPVEASMERVELVEQAIVIGSVATLWPWIFGYREPWYQWGALSLVALTLVVITVRKWRRMNQAFDDAKDAWGDQGAPSLGGMPLAPPMTKPPRGGTGEKSGSSKPGRR